MRSLLILWLQYLNKSTYLRSLEQETNFMFCFKDAQITLEFHEERTENGWHVQPNRRPSFVS